MISRFGASDGGDHRAHLSSSIHWEFWKFLTCLASVRCSIIAGDQANRALNYRHRNTHNTSYWKMKHESPKRWSWRWRNPKRGKALLLVVSKYFIPFPIFTFFIWKCHFSVALNNSCLMISLGIMIIMGRETAASFRDTGSLSSSSVFRSLLSCLFLSPSSSTSSSAITIKSIILIYSILYLFPLHHFPPRLSLSLSSCLLPSLKNVWSPQISPSHLLPFSRRSPFIWFHLFHLLHLNYSI